jgi:hypothetical protein
MKIINAVARLCAGHIDTSVCCSFHTTVERKGSECRPMLVFVIFEVGRIVLMLNRTNSSQSPNMPGGVELND